LKRTYTIGLMSGTSLDATDGVLIEWHSPGHTSQDALSFTLHARASVPLSAAHREALLQLNSPSFNELHTSSLAANALALDAASVVHDLLQQIALPAHAIAAVGLHGQTVRHQPGLYDGYGYTVQLHNASLLAELCGIDVITDFRRRDVAAGGQGAPLVPAFHAALLNGQTPTAVLNIGGFANLSLLYAPDEINGLDTGPGNVLLDAWCQRHQGTAFDPDGQWAASGVVIPELLNHLLQHPYFALPAPKSTGRDDFHIHWLDQQLAHYAQHIAPIDAHKPPAPADVQATLSNLTAHSIAAELHTAMPNAEHLWVCGGGALNRHLMLRLEAACHTHGFRIHIQNTQALGLDVMDVEAAAFGWLALQHLQQQPGNCPAVTGARGPRILGCRYPR
jgi:anhydro-N-acetylmuramic acid kinase